MGLQSSRGTGQAMGQDPSMRSTWASAPPAEPATSADLRAMFLRLGTVEPPAESQPEPHDYEPPMPIEAPPRPPEVAIIQRRPEGPRVTPNMAVLEAFSDRREIEKDVRWSAGCPSCCRGDVLRITVAISGEIRLHCSNNCALPAILSAAHLEAAQLLPKNAVSSDDFAVVTLDDLLAEPSEQLSYVWQNTLPTGGLSILGAKPKVGKSTLARTLMLCVSRGEPFLDRGTKKGPVLYLALEDKRSELQAAFHRLGMASAELLVHTGRAPQMAMPALRRVIKRHRPVLVVIDTLQKFMRIEDLNDYAKVNKAMEELLDVARVSGAHIMVLHHFNKAATGGGDGLLGSTALFGAVDCLLEMHKRDDCRTLASTQRYGVDLPETIVAIDEHTGAVRANGVAEQLASSRVRQQVLGALDEPRTFDQLRDQLRMGPNTLQRLLREMMQEGSLSRVGSGKSNDPYRYLPAMPEDRAA